MALTPEELAELTALEKEETSAAEAKSDAVARQSLEAKRMRKRLAAKHGEHGRDFVVVELDTGLNVAMRRPLDVEVDGLNAEKADRAELEKFLLALVIEPTSAEMQKCFAGYPGVVGALPKFVGKMLGGVREEEAKK